MIVRVMEEDQYQIDDAHASEFERLDNELLATVRQHDQVAFLASLTALVQFVRDNGQRVPYIEIVPSDIVVPAPDMTLAEAEQFLTTDTTTP